MFIKKHLLIVAALSIISLLTSCAVTTDSTESSSETFGNTTHASSEFTSSTSPSMDKDEESAMVIKYVATNYDQLRADISVGEGEHLEALASLLSVDRDNKVHFYSLVMDNFNALYPVATTTPEEFVANLHSLRQKNIF